ncbi:MAG TPA: pyridoxal-phosphate dependent enzyme [Puia sp.]|nr:pyridoxal-phosphate dependent enzyme [Puia sp.]
MDNLLMDNLTKRSFDYPLSIDTLTLPEWAQQRISADVLRLDKLHPVISGNKWFKLKGYVQAAIQQSGQHLITFGGAWSNHIVATACLAQQAGLRAIGFIRGECPALLSDTLQEAAGYGMQLEFLSREAYKTKDSPVFLEQLATRYPGAFIIPEGGAGNLGIKGSEDILQTVDTSSYSHILCAIGTGTMYQGLVNAAAPGQTVIGVPVLKGMNTLAAISREGWPPGDKLPYCRLLPDYHFGGYARHTPELLGFMNRWYQTTGIPSDFVYTGKLFYAALDSIHKQLFPPGSRLLLIHSGGLQGNRSLSPGLLVF